MALRSLLTLRCSVLDHHLSPPFPFPGLRGRKGEEGHRESYGGLTWGAGFGQEHGHPAETLRHWGWGHASVWLTPYLQAASVVSFSLFFTCGVEVFSRSPRACCVEMPAFSAA